MIDDLSLLFKKLSVVDGFFMLYKNCCFWEDENERGGKAVLKDDGGLYIIL